MLNPQEFDLCVYLCEYNMYRIGQSHIYTPYMTVYLVISMPEVPYMHHICGSGQLKLHMRW
jgi:hypothetical protein